MKDWFCVWYSDIYNLLLRRHIHIAKNEKSIRDSTIESDRVVDTNKDVCNINPTISVVTMSSAPIVSNISIHYSQIPVKRARVFYRNIDEYER